MVHTAAQNEEMDENLSSFWTSIPEADLTSVFYNRAKYDGWKSSSALKAQVWLIQKKLIQVKKDTYMYLDNVFKIQCPKLDLYVHI